jgi:hypothetical protein
MWLQVEARGLKPNTKYFYQFRYRQNDRKAPVRATWTECCLACKPYTGVSAKLCSIYPAVPHARACVHTGVLDHRPHPHPGTHLVEDNVYLHSLRDHHVIRCGLTVQPSVASIKVNSILISISISIFVTAPRRRGHQARPRRLLRLLAAAPRLLHSLRSDCPHGRAWGGRLQPALWRLHL